METRDKIDKYLQEAKKLEIEEKNALFSSFLYDNQNVIIYKVNNVYKNKNTNTLFSTKEKAEKYLDSKTSVIKEIKLLELNIDDMERIDDPDNYSVSWKLYKGD